MFYFSIRRHLQAEGLNPDQATIASELQRDVSFLADGFPGRSTQRPQELEGAARLLENALHAAGYQTTRQTYSAGGVPCHNIEAEIGSEHSDHGVLVVGAHYDAVPVTPGADDNGSAVAGLLAIARRLRGHPLRHALRFVLFANEEPPWFQTAEMGSMVYATACKARGDKVSMICLESIGYYSDKPGSQDLPQVFPAPIQKLLPNQGDFIALVSNPASSGLLRRVTKAFRRAVRFPYAAAAVPEGITGVGFSDQWGFWRNGFPAVMVTDTALFRNPNYHTANDRPGTLDYAKTALVVDGFVGVVKELSGG